MYRDGLEQYKHMWQKSLKYLGNISYRGSIPKEAITRYCTFDTTKRPHLALTILDPTITLMNYLVIGWKYQEIIKWMFGDLEQLPEIKYLKQFCTTMPGIQKTIDNWIEESKNKSGVTVVNRKESILKVVKK